MGEGKSTTLSLTLVITIFGFLITGLSTYFGVTYSVANEINLLKQAAETKDGRISALEEEVKSYRALPNQMKTLQKTSNETRTIVGVIRDGLIAKGIIKPGA